MPLNLFTLLDPPFVLKSSVFEERKKVIAFFLNSPEGGASNLAFNISVRETDSVARLALSINGVEIQRYSVKNRPISSINEYFDATESLRPGNNTIEFEIVDTPLTEGAKISISDVLMWTYTT